MIKRFLDEKLGEYTLFGIPDDELLTDRRLSSNDIGTQETYLTWVEKITPGNKIESDVKEVLIKKIQECIEGNKKIIAVIDAELERRKHGAQEQG